MEVTSALSADFEAVLHSYGDLQVIHVAAPDLRQQEYEDETLAVEALTESYTNVLRVFASSNLSTLRLLPLFGGLSRNRFSTSLPSMMIGALGAAYTNLDTREQQRILTTSVELCIYAEVEFASYSEHLMRLQKALEPYLPAPPMSPLQAALLRSMSWESGGGGLRRSPNSRSPPGSSPGHRLTLSPTATPGGTATQFRRLANDFEITEQEEVPEMYGTHEMPLTEEQMHYALEPRLGDRPGTGHCLLRTNAEGGGAPTSRPPPPDISALSSMATLRARAKQRVGKFALGHPKLRRTVSLGRKADAFRTTAEKVIVSEHDEPWEVIRFDPDWKSSTIDLLEEHRVASWSLSMHGGMAMSRQMVRRSAIGRYFEVQIDFTDDAVWSDGLGIGVAVKAGKGASQNLAGVSNLTQGYACELLPLSWLVGYDGTRAKICGYTRYLTNAEMPQGLWRPSQLQSGDILALLVTESGTMMLFVNDVLRVIVQHCEELDRQWKGQLHAVIDLDGCTRSVRFLDTNGLPSREVSLLYASLKQAENAARPPTSFDETTN